MASLICYKHFVPIGTDKSLVRDDMFKEKLPPKGIGGGVSKGIFNRKDRQAVAKIAKG